jgi:hypothetical protein
MYYTHEFNDFYKIIIITSDFHTYYNSSEYELEKIKWRSSVQRFKNCVSRAKLFNTHPWEDTIKIN